VSEAARYNGLMDLKFSDYVTIAVAILIPVIGFGVLIVPGAMSAVVDFVMQEDRRPYIFYGGAAVVFAVLAFRIYRRIRPKPDKKQAGQE
jgi:hypothetical protein